MTSCVALLRGINVGGHNILPMQEFRELLTNLDCADVATYIQSGNAVFRSAARVSKLSVSIADGIAAKYGFRPTVLVLTGTDFETIAAANPFDVPSEQAKHVHIWFLQRPASRPNIARLNQLAAPSEKFVLTDAAFYLHAPFGIGRSKLAAEGEKCLGVPATGRNLRTVFKILELSAR